MTRHDREKIRYLTLGCWWPSKQYPKPCPDWGGIASDLKAALEDARSYGRQEEIAELERLVALAQAEEAKHGPTFQAYLERVRALNAAEEANR